MLNANQRQYLFGIVFLLFGFYQAYQSQLLEFSLYSLAGLSFILNQLTNEPKLYAYKKQLVVITWVLIIATGLTFFYLLQFKFL
jgi:hypothetical protein